MGSGKVEGGMKCIKWLMMLFNFIFFLVGLALIICGALVMTQFKVYVTVLGDSFDAAPLVIIVAGVVIFLVSFFGCCGAWKENYCMVMTFASLMVLLLILQLSAAIAGFVMRSKVRSIIQEPLKQALKSYNNGTEYKNVFDAIQTNLKCCGVENRADWAEQKMSIPDSCGSYTAGCLIMLDEWISSNVLIVAGGALGVAFVQLIGILFACCLGRAIKKEYDVV